MKEQFIKRAENQFYREKLEGLAQEIRSQVEEKFPEVKFYNYGSVFFNLGIPGKIQAESEGKDESVWMYLLEEEGRENNGEWDLVISKADFLGIENEKKLIQASLFALNLLQKKDLNVKIFRYFPKNKMDGDFCKQNHLVSSQEGEEQKLEYSFDLIANLQRQAFLLQEKITHTTRESIQKLKILKTGASAFWKELRKEK